MTADVQRELAEALAPKLRESYGGYLPRAASDADWLSDADWAVDALLPTVQALIADAEKRAAAAALREAAEQIAEARDACPNDERRRGYGSALFVIKSRAAALDPSGAAEGAGR